MFYYPNVLQYGTGCFSTIWLAATKAIKISRRDFLKINVQRTCNDIMDYVLVRAPPLQPGLPRPRLSLYLSSQLQYGVVIVYHRQCAILLEEIQQAIDRLMRSASSLKIDLVEPDRLVLTLPDSLSVLEESERAQDPFFGVMGFTLPSPSALIQQWQAAEEVSPLRPLVKSPGTPHEDGITASPESITLIETGPAISSLVEFEGVELAEVTPKHMDIIEMLMEQQDQFPEEAEEEEREQEREAERIIEQQRTTAEQLGATAVADEDPVWMPEEGMVLPAEVPAVVPLEMTPVSAIPLPSSPDRQREGETQEERVSRSERDIEQDTERQRERERERERETSSLEFQERDVAPKKRRRQLLFIDTQTQIPQEELREMIRDPLTKTQPLALIENPSRRRLSPEELLSNPCTRLHPDILALWKEGAVITPLSSAAARKRVTETETESDRESVVAVEEERGKEKEETEEISSKEVFREFGQTQPEVSVPSELIAEASDKDMSRPVFTPESRGSTGEIIFPLQGIPEERARSPEKEIQQTFVTRENLLRMVWEPLLEDEMVFFHSLLPPLADRSTVACTFSTLLDLVSARILNVQQDEPYGIIKVSPGPLYEQGLDKVMHID